MWRKLGIEPGEGRIFAWGAAALFLLGWCDVSVKNVAETIFLKRVGVEFIPLVFLASSVVLVGTTWAMARIAAESDRLTLLPRTLVGLGLMLVPIWLLVRDDVQASFSLLLIVSKEITSIALVVFWIAMGDLLHGRQAKRLFAPMMAGVTLGSIFGSFASDPLGRWLGIDALLPVSVVVLLLGACAALPLRKLRPRLRAGAAGLRPGPGRREPEEDAAGRSAGLAALWRESALFRLLFATALCSGLLGPMLYFQFSYVADLATKGAHGEQRLLAFYAQFRGWINLATLATQLLVASSLYRAIGIPLSIALAPLVYLFGFLGLSVRLSLPAGVGAMAGTKLQDSAVYDPAVRVLYNLLPERIRARATGLIEGPVKRAGGALGNVATYAAVALASARWVGVLALPIAAVWLGAGLLLWRRYPRLLLAATRSGDRGALEGADLLDPATLRALRTDLCSPDPAHCRTAVELVCEARPERAVPVLAQAAAEAPEQTRPILVAALDRLLEGAVARPVHSPEAARAAAQLLAAPAGLSGRDRADLVQALGRLSSPGDAAELLDGALLDPAPAVRLAALGALERRGSVPAGAPAFDAALEAAVAGDDADARRTAREELRALLIAGEPDPLWERRLSLLSQLLAREDDRGDAAEAIADVARRHGERAAAVGPALMLLRDDPDARVRAALLRFAGCAGLEDQASWVVDHLAAPHPSWAEAARDGLRAFGPLAAQMLLRELAYGQRSKREGILEVMRELHVQPETLRALYESELDSVQRDLGYIVALTGRASLDLLRQRLEERVQEQLHTAVLFLAAIRHEDRIAELGTRLQQAHGRERQRAILLEALEALLPAEEQARIIPLLEVRGAARDGGPSADQALRDLLKDAEDLTRTIASGLAVAAGIELEDHDGVDVVDKMLRIKALPIFEGLTTRQLMDLARVVKEQSLPEGTVVVHQGEFDDCLYLVVDGVIHILRGERLLAEVGPGDFFGEIALFEGTARSATAVTRSRARLLSLERADLMRIIEEMPGIAISLLQTLSRRVRELTDRLTV